MTTSTLPVSPIASASIGPAAQAGVVQIDLGTLTKQIVTGAEFGLATTMGDFNHTYLPYGDRGFQAIVNQYPTDLLRHNWELNTMMDIMFPSRASASTPNFSFIDNYLNQQGNLKGFFNNQTGTQVVTLGFPSWLNISSASDQALYASMAKGIAQHLIAAGEPVQNYELVNEPDGHYSVADMARTFNAVAQALKSVDPAYKLGGLTETYAKPADFQTFFQIAGSNIGFVSWHQYVTNGSDGKSDQQVVTDSMNAVASDARTVRAEMQAAGIPDSVPLFLGEYNVNGAVYTAANNGNMIGAVAAAATTYGMIHSNTNMTMGALWDVVNDSAYSIFGSQGAYHVNPVGVVLADLTAYMPGSLVRTTMPSNAPGLVGYTTVNGQGFSTALIDTNLAQGYTVDLSRNGLPTTGLYRVEVSNASPQGTKTALTDLSHVSVAAGSVVIITNEAPHGGTEFTGTAASTPVPAPTPTPAPSPTPPSAAGSDTLVLSLSEDAWQGDAQAVVTVDGKAVGGTVTVTALHNQGRVQTVALSGQWGGGAHDIGVQFINDAYGGQPTTDRNLYVNAVSLDGQASTAPPATLWSAGTAHFAVAASPLVLRLSEDAYLGDAQFTVAVDGKVLGAAQSVTALHAKGASQNFAFGQAMAAGTHDIAVSFLNDAWGGSTTTDRNLYVAAVTVNGTAAAGTAATLLGTSTQHFSVAVAAHL